MKKILLSLLVLFASFCLFSQERIKNTSFMIEPFAIGASIAQNGFVLAFEGQTAIDDIWAIYSAIELGELSDFTVFSFEFGMQVFPWGNYLNGFFLGAYPGYTFGLDKNGTYYDDQSYFLFFIQAMGGYQIVFKNSLTMELSGGVIYFPGYGVNPGVNLGIGLTYADPFIKIYE